jgi:hypothetical protein
LSGHIFATLIGVLHRFFRFARTFKYFSGLKNPKELLRVANIMCPHSNP